jgi:hypothetical protein
MESRTLIYAAGETHARAVEAYIRAVAGSGRAAPSPSVVRVDADAADVALLNDPDDEAVVLAVTWGLRQAAPVRCGEGWRVCDDDPAEPAPSDSGRGAPPQRRLIEATIEAISTNAAAAEALLARWAAPHDVASPAVEDRTDTAAGRTGRGPARAGRNRRRKETER